ncbi:hypothetical protein BLNAU_14017 [Blattamonas nauphoetae]|uniref:WH2 domain-containing protein n=1 Tax=Blattamonas nauphoetae TaxID=2049346 RepID=A0ABQ9XLD4_9EUKA|nr:hypothetical protein BLNAU_14017 [Blattamonas nauphoetae]
MTQFKGNLTQQALLDMKKQQEASKPKDNPFLSIKATAAVPDGRKLLQEKEREIAKLKQQFGLLGSPNKTLRAANDKSNIPIAQPGESTIPPAPPLPPPDAIPKKRWINERTSPMKRPSPLKNTNRSILQEIGERTPLRSTMANRIQSHQGTPISQRDLLKQSSTLKQTSIQRSPGGTPIKTREMIERQSQSGASSLAKSLQSRLLTVRSGVIGDEDSDSSSDGDF